MEIRENFFLGLEMQEKEISEIFFSWTRDAPYIVINQMLLKAKIPESRIYSAAISYYKMSDLNPCNWVYLFIYCEHTHKESQCSDPGTHVVFSLSWMIAVTVMMPVRNSCKPHHAFIYAYTKENKG